MNTEYLFEQVLFAHIRVYHETFVSQRQLK